MSEINLTLDEGDAKTVAEALRANHVEWLAEIVEAQLPKATITEPTEFGSEVTVADSDGNRYRLFCGGPAYGTARWFDDDGNRYEWDVLRNVEVLRVGVGGAHLPNNHGATVEIDLDTLPPAEAVEADKAPSRFIARHLAPDQSLLDSDVPTEPAPVMRNTNLGRQICLADCTLPRGHAAGCVR